MIKGIVSLRASMREIAESAMAVPEFERFIALPENQSRLFELVDGKVIEKVPTQEHGIIVGKIIIRLGGFAEANNLGTIAPEVRHRLPNSEVDEWLPDIAFYLKIEQVVERGASSIMPDMVIEVKSPDDSYKSMVDRAYTYLLNGVKMVWLVYPEKRLVEILTADDRWLLGLNDYIEDIDFLPGFRLLVKDIFPN